MTRTIVYRAVAASALLLAAAGCGTLDVSDPTAIQDSELANASGANLLRQDALIKLYRALSTGAFQSAVLSDEVFADTPAIYELYGIVNQFEILDRRRSVPFEQQGGSFYIALQQARTAPTIAMPGVRTYIGPDRTGEMLAARGYATLMLAEFFCPGFPLHRLEGSTPVYGLPRTTAEVFEDALADFDSAVALSADSARINNWARMGRARALLGLGRLEEAGQAATSVPVLYQQLAQYNGTSISQPNELGRAQYNDGFTSNVSVANQEGGNGLDFVSAGDPRVVTAPGFLADDGVTRLYSPSKYPNTSASIVMASGVEARLIEAEAALAAHDVTTWRDKLNEPRRNAWSTIVPAVSGPLADLPDPGNDADRLALTFRERAFWLWGTGHRLGDLRRMIAQYGAGAESVYPTGAYRLGQTYDVATSIPFQASLETNFSPTVTGCTSR